MSMARKRVRRHRRCFKDAQCQLFSADGRTDDHGAKRRAQDGGGSDTRMNGGSRKPAAGNGEEESAVAQRATVEDSFVDCGLARSLKPTTTICFRPGTRALTRLDKGGTCQERDGASPFQRSVASRPARCRVQMKRRPQRCLRGCSTVLSVSLEPAARRRACWALRGM
jgi:hypothetical protein